MVSGWFKLAAHTIMRTLVFIWFLIGPTIQTILFVLLTQRRLYRRGLYPWFCTYTLYSIVVSVVRLVLVQQPAHYLWFYWSTEIIYGILALLSLNEVFTRTFFLDYQEHPRLRLILPITVLAVFFGLFLWWKLAYITPSGGHLSFPWSAFVAFIQGVHSVEGLLLVLFMVFWLLLVPGWNRYDYGILLGFGLSGLVTMSADMVRFNGGHGYQVWYKYAPGLTYLAVTIIWLHAFWQAREPRPKSLVHFRTLIESAKSNNEMIKLIVRWLDRQ